MTTFTRKIVKKDLSKEQKNEDTIVVLTKAPEEKKSDKDGE